MAQKKNTSFKILNTISKIMEREINDNNEPPEDFDENDIACIMKYK